MIGFSAALLPAEDFGSWLERVNEYNPEYRKIVTDQELSGINRTKGLIEAVNKSDEYSVEITYFNDIANSKKDLISYYTDLLGTGFSLGSANITLQAAEIRNNTAEISYSRTKQLFNSGRVQEYEVEELRIALLESQKGLNQARSDVENLLRYFRHITGMDWNSKLESMFTNPEFVRWKPEQSLWLDKDLDHRKAVSSLKYAERAVDSLSGNAPAFEQRKAKAQLENARLQLEAAEFNAKPNYENIIRNIESLKNTIVIVTERLNLEEKKFADATLRFEKSIISAEQYSQQRISELSAKKAYLDAWKQYMTAIIGEMVAVEAQPAEVFQ